MEQESKPQKDADERDYVGWAALGFEFAGVVAVFCYIGYKLDEVLNTSPWLLIIGFAIGLIGMLYTIFKKAWYMWHK